MYLFPCVVGIQNRRKLDGLILTRFFLRICWFPTHVIKTSPFQDRGAAKVLRMIAVLGSMWRFCQASAAVL